MAFRDELVEWFKRDPCAKEQFRLGRVYGAVMVNPNGGAAIEIAGPSSSEHVCVPSRSLPLLWREPYRGARTSTAVRLLRWRSVTALAVALTVVGLALCATAVYCVNVWAAVEQGRGGDEGEEVNAVGFHAEYGSDEDDDG